MIKKINNDKELLKQYVKLRNKYSDILLSDKVDYKGTLEWLKKVKVSIFAEVAEDKVLGVLVLYHDKKNEICFFVKTPKQGIGTKLLKHIEHFKDMWAFVADDNYASQGAFLKAGYEVEKTTFKKNICGFIYKLKK